MLKECIHEDILTQFYFCLIMTKILKEVDEDIAKVIKRNKKELETALIKPIHKQHPFSSNGMYLFCGRPGSGKTYYIMKHILLSEKLFEKPYYNLIVFCSTSNGLDKTVLAFKDKIKTPLIFINDSELLDFLEEHVKAKMRYYSIYRFIMNDFKKPDETMQEIIRVNGLNTKTKLVKYLANELAKYQTNRYPLNCLVVLDDFANNELLINKKSKLHTYFTKTRHYNITFIIAVQTVKFIPKNIKRMTTDCVLYGGISEEDFIGLMKELSHPWNIQKLFEEYKQKCSQEHVKLILNLSVPSYSFDFN